MTFYSLYSINKKVLFQSHHNQWARTKKIDLYSVYLNSAHIAPLYTVKSHHSNDARDSICFCISMKRHSIDWLGNCSINYIPSNDRNVTHYQYQYQVIIVVCIQIFYWNEISIFQSESYIDCWQNRYILKRFSEIYGMQINWS